MAIKISNFHQISKLYLTIFDANTATTRFKYKSKYNYATFKILRYKYKYKYQFLCIYKYKYVFDHILACTQKRKHHSSGKNFRHFW